MDLHKQQFLNGLIKNTQYKGVIFLEKSNDYNFQKALNNNLSISGDKNKDSTKIKWYCPCGNQELEI